MPTAFHWMSSFLSSPYESNHSVTLRLPATDCVHRDDTQHVYRLPPPTLDTQWTHYKVALHSSTGHQQLIPLLVIKEHGYDSQERILQEREYPSIDWQSLPLIAHSEVYLHVAIPSTVYSEGCVVTIQLHGTSLITSKPCSTLSR